MRKVIDVEIGDEILAKITHSEFGLVALAAQADERGLWACSVSVWASLTDTPLSGASPLPHLLPVVSGSGG
ncbi:hypothetical protein [Pseudomonas sp. 31 R 17]|nr:hypothetical protein [Pseudomonas sp. 31 R 17]